MSHPGDCLVKTANLSAPAYQLFTVRRCRIYVADTAGAIAVAACQHAHAVLAARGEWVTNEKTLIDRAGLRGVDDVLAGLVPDPGRLERAVAEAAALMAAQTG
jgi:hypothetical protein